MSKTQTVWVIESVHPLDECAACDVASDKAINMARTTGTAEARYRDANDHGAIVNREERSLKMVPAVPVVL